jgi:hypothetical protein
VFGVEGYHLFTDRYYSSVQLAQELDNQKCHTTSTIIVGIVGSRKPVRQEAIRKMKNGDTYAQRSGNVLLMGWKDMRVLLKMCTYHNTSTEKMMTIQKVGQQKSQCVHTENVGDADCSDHFCTTYAFI